jgi:hypothetical protein
VPHADSHERGEREGGHGVEQVDDLEGRGMLQRDHRSGDQAADPDAGVQHAEPQRVGPRPRLLRQLCGDEAVQRREDQRVPGRRQSDRDEGLPRSRRDGEQRRARTLHGQPGEEQPAESDPVAESAAQR